MNTKLPENSLILLEGGSLRGLYTAGALDILMEHDLYFPAVAGVSAGALNAYNYVPTSLAARPASTCATATTAGTSAPRRRCAAAACLA